MPDAPPVGYDQTQRRTPMAQETVLIGYLPKQFTKATGDIHRPAYSGVEEICSVSECIAKSPPAWVGEWLHNTDTWLFDTPEAAWSVVPAAEREQYRLYAYRLLPTLFHESGEEAEHPLPELTAVPIPDAFSRLGYDAVVRAVGKTEVELHFPNQLRPLAAVMQRHG